MLISVGDIRLFVDVFGSALVESSGEMRGRPAMLFLHGGPGFDHMSLRPQYEALADTAQLFFMDHRGNGRSDRSEPRHWNLAQWSQDVAALIEALGLNRPIIFGQSFGGIVAQRYAVDHPGTYSGLILSSTLATFDLELIVANFNALHGPEIADLARRYFSNRTEEVAEAYNRRCFPLYTVSGAPLGAVSIRHSDVAAHFFSSNGEGLNFDLRPLLNRIKVPTLIMGGDRDPVVPVAGLEDIVRNFAPGVASKIIFPDCGHGPARDQPERTLAVLREYIVRVSNSADLMR